MVFKNVAIRIYEHVGTYQEDLSECIESIKIVREEYEDVYIYPQSDKSLVFVQIYEDDTCKVRAFNEGDAPRVLPIFPREGTGIIFRSASEHFPTFHLRVDEYGMWEDSRDYTDADPQSIEG